MSTFKIVLTGIFVACLVIGIGIFALSKGSSATSAKLVVWGTIAPEVFDASYKASSVAQNKNVTVTYVKKDSATFDTQFVEALADGIGPDMVILRDDSVYKHRNKLFAIPYKNYTERDFRDRFFEGGEVFLNNDGVVALPYIVDPIVLYWNRDMLSNALVSQPPEYWDEVYPLINTLTKKDAGGVVTQSAFPFGEWRNVNNAKEILSTLLFQSGTPITTRTKQGISLVLNSAFDYQIAPSTATVNFYTQFSNPTSANYTWNRSLPPSQSFFLAGKLAFYPGMASELFSIQQKNPNLNFDVTTIPQVRKGAKKVVFGHLYGIALVKQSKQLGPAFGLAIGLTEPSALSAMEQFTNLPPVRRDMLAVKQTDAFRSVFYTSALLSRAWVDPDGVGSANAFRDMIESITSGRATVGDGLSNLEQSLIQLYAK